VGFDDADLIGLPIRVTVGDRSLKQDSIEFKRRDQKEKRLIPLAEAIEAIQAEVAALEAAVNSLVVLMIFGIIIFAKHYCFATFAGE